MYGTHMSYKVAIPIEIEDIDSHKAFIEYLQSLVKHAELKCKIDQEELLTRRRSTVIKRKPKNEKDVKIEDLPPAISI